MKAWKVVVAVAAALLATTGAAQAQIGIAYEVNSTGDGAQVGNVQLCNDGAGHCTLRAAMQAANAHAGTDAITFAIPATDPNCAGDLCAIQLGSALPSISENVNVVGPGAARLSVNGGRLTDAQFRVIFVQASITVSISGLTLRNASLKAGAGSAITNAGALHLTDCTIADNYAQGYDVLGGTVVNTGTLTLERCLVTGNLTRSGTGGAIVNHDGSVTVTDCRLEGNFAEGNGGGAIFSDGGAVFVTQSVISGNVAEQNYRAAGGGILVSNGATLTLTSSFLSMNSAQGADGGHQGGAVSVRSSGATIEGCTFSGNQAAAGDASSDPLSDAGGIYNRDGTVKITNSTFWGNNAQRGGGALNDGTGALLVTNSTFTANTASGGGGLFNNSSTTVSVKSSIIAGNTGGAVVGPDVNGSFNSEGFNLIGKNVAATASFPAGNPNANRDIVGTGAAPIDPKLDPAGPQNHGGATPSIALLPFSPAIDQGSSDALTHPLGTDQRGAGFPRTANFSNYVNATGGDGTDIGALEFWELRITSVSRATNGHILLGGVGFPSRAHNIDASPGLDPSNFAALPSPVTPDGTGSFQADLAPPTGAPRQFYRIRLP